MMKERRSHCLSPVHQVALFINRMRSGCKQRTSGLDFGISGAQANKIFWNILFKFVAIFRSLIKLPTVDELEEITNKIRERGEEFDYIKYVADGMHMWSNIKNDWNSSVSNA